MDAKSIKKNPLRRPQWRADRARLLAEHRPKPLPAQSSDDRYVRAYRRLLILKEAACGDRSKQFSAFVKQPHAALAERIYYWPDREYRNVLEARLLTGEAFSDIAFRCEIKEKTVAHYAVLFFDVWDRLNNLDDTTWIDGVILDRNYLPVSGRDGVISEEQRGFVYRLFGFYGGPDVLEAVIRSLGPGTMPECRQQMAAWLDDAAAQIVQSWADAGTRYRDLNTDNVLQLLNEAVSRPTTTRARKRPPSDFEVLVAKVVAGLGGHELPEHGELLRSPSHP